MSPHLCVIEIAAMQQTELIPINLLRITRGSEVRTHGVVHWKDVQSLLNVCSLSFLFRHFCYDDF
jgi:hypothetical protein